MQTNCLPVRHAERPWSHPDAGRDADSAQIVHQRRSPEVGGRLLRYAQRRCSTGDKIRHTARMPSQMRNLQVGKISAGEQDRLQLSVVDDEARRGLCRKRRGSTRQHRRAARR